MHRMIAAWLVILAAATAGAQVVSPMQAGHYFPGIMDVRDLTNPPPGLFFALYNVHVSSDTYIDRGGNRLREINLSELDPALPDLAVDLDLSAFTSVPVIAWASSFKVLGATWVPFVVLPAYTTADTRVFAETTPGPIVPPVGTGVSSSVSGLGDIFVQPMGLSWGFKSFDLMAAYGFYAPTGRYETGASDNIGLGFWTHQFQAFGYWYPMESRATSLMLGLTWEINSDIEDVDVQPGDRLSVEWGVSQYLTRRFEFTFQGAHNRQVGDDSGRDVWWDPSVHDWKNSLVVGLNYWMVPDRLYLAFKYGWDHSMRQRFDNDMLILNLLWAPGILNGQ